MLEAKEGQQLLERVAFLLIDSQNFEQSRRLQGLREDLVAHRAAQLKVERLEESILHGLDEVGKAALDAAE